MTGVVLLAVVLDRTAISLRLVAWAAMIVLLIAPESLLGPSFQMSFGAVVALVATYESWRSQAIRPDGLGKGRLVGLVALYLLATVVTTVVAGSASGASEIGRAHV